MTPASTTETKHTPGPWKAVATSHGPIDIFDARDRDIVTLYGGGVGLENQAANARLIAAAPEMLEAAMPFNLPDWLSNGVLTDLRSDGLRINLSIPGTDYEATVTVGELRALSAAIAKAVQS